MLLFQQTAYKLASSIQEAQSAISKQKHLRMPALPNCSVQFLIAWNLTQILRLISRMKNLNYTHADRCKGCHGVPKPISVIFSIIFRAFYVSYYFFKWFSIKKTLPMIWINMWQRDVQYVYKFILLIDLSVCLSVLSIMDYLIKR